MKKAPENRPRFAKLETAGEKRAVPTLSYHW